MLRLLATGALGPVFGIRKVAVAGRSPTAYAIAVQPDGKILVAGETTIGTNSTADFFVARLMPNGTADPNFGSPNNGYVVTDPSGLQQDDRANNILLQPDGKIVLSGTSASSTSFDIFPTAVRLSASGSLDNTFGTDCDTLAQMLTCITNDLSKPNFYRRTLNYSNLDSLAEQDFVFSDLTSTTSKIAFGTANLLGVFTCLVYDRRRTIVK